MKKFCVLTKIFFLVNYICTINSMGVNGLDNPIIQFEKKEQCLLNHIKQCSFDASYQFGVTDVMIKDNNHFVCLNNIHYLDKQKCLQPGKSVMKNIISCIKQCEWIYVPCYKSKLTALNSSKMVNVGAIILYTNDVDDAKKLCSAFVNKTIKY